MIQHGIDQAERADRMALIKGTLHQTRGEAAAGAIASDRDRRAEEREPARDDRRERARERRLDGVDLRTAARTFLAAPP